MPDDWRLSHLLSYSRSTDQRMIVSKLSLWQEWMQIIRHHCATRRKARLCVPYSPVHRRPVRMEQENLF